MVVKFNSKNINKEKLGNKASFLIEMTHNGFQVLNGIVLDSDTYDEIIKNNELDEKIKKLLDKLNKNNIKNISNKIFNLFNEIEIPNNILEEINNLIKDNKKYAVRSSGTKEDLDNYSFAGQYETFLNVNKKDISNKIIECYKSMYSETLLSYLCNNNIVLEILFHLLYFLLILVLLQ